MISDNEGEKYNKIATEYSKLRNSFNTEKKYLDLFMEYLEPNANILDVGCGSGYPIASYLNAHKIKVTGIDSSKELLKIAANKCPEMSQIYGDVRTIILNNKYDGIIEWWCLFHLPKIDHKQMIGRFASWLKPGGILEFTTGDGEYEGKSSDMLNQELSFYSLSPIEYEKYLKDNNFKILLRESDQDQHLVWIAKYGG